MNFVVLHHPPPGYPMTSALREDLRARQPVRVWYTPGGGLARTRLEDVNPQELEQVGIGGDAYLLGLAPAPPTKEHHGWEEVVEGLGKLTVDKGWDAMPDVVTDECSTPSLIEAATVER